MCCTVEFSFVKNKIDTVEDAGGLTVEFNYFINWIRTFLRMQEDSLVDLLLLPLNDDVVLQQAHR